MAYTVPEVALPNDALIEIGDYFRFLEFAAVMPAIQRCINMVATLSARHAVA